MSRSGSVGFSLANLRHLNAVVSEMWMPVLASAVCVSSTVTRLRWERTVFNSTSLLALFMLVNGGNGIL